MVFTPVISDRQLKKEDRRSHPRRRCEQLDYTDFGPDNGGILLDLSEGGLGFQGVEAVTEGQLIHLKFTLPGASTNIKADARVARTNDSRKGGGLRFVDLSEDARQRVRAWVTGEITGATGADGRPSFVAINPPELSTADSAAMEQACALVAARISSGLGFQGVEAVTEGQLIHLKFTLPGTSTNIKADAWVARTNDSRKGGGLRFVDLSEDVRQRVRAWVTGAITGARPSGTFVTGADGRPSFGAISPPELSTADSAAMEQACTLVAARISGVPDVKPDEAATPTLSSAEHGAGDESLGTTASPDLVATTPDVVGINQASIDHGTVDRARGLPEPLKPLLPPEPLPPPEQAATEKASACAPDLSAPESLRVSFPAPEPAPAAAVAAPGAGETPLQARLSTQSVGPQTPGTKDIHSEGISGMQGKLPTRQQIERRAYEIYAKRGGQSGNDMGDRIAVEKELTSRLKCKAAEPSSLEHQQDCTATRMLLDFHGLREQPFGMSPDPAYLYASRTHREAFTSLSFGIQDSRGFLALIAEPGMGKTTLLHQLLEDLRDSARTVFVFQTQCDSRELFQYILHELDVDAQGMGLVAMHNRLNELLFEQMLAGKRFVLVVDEAQNLDESVLETVRLLSNFETDHTKLLQIVLAGQPRLAAKLAQPQLSQLRQRIAVLSHLEPFTATDTADYINHRLRVAGYCREPLFAPGAVDLIAHRSQGIPRNINNICYNSLLMAYVGGHRTVTSEIVQEAVARLAIGPLAPNR